MNWLLYGPKNSNKLIFGPVIWLAIIAFVFNIGLSFTGFYDWTFDSWAHMFFASHYMESWFDTWDPRWFGGFTVTSYPPLVTQGLAVAGSVIGLENAYILFSITGMILVPLAVYYYCGNFLSHKETVIAALISIFLPSLYLTNYTWGQIPSMFALISALFAGHFLWRYLSHGGIRNCLIASVLVAITATCHHLTFICLIPLIVIMTTAMFVLQTKSGLKKTLRRLIAYSLLSLPLIIISTYPFWQFALESGIQREIPHITRTNLFDNWTSALEFVIAPYFLLLVFIPFTPLAIRKDPRLVPILITVLFLFLLGLGGTTPIPKLIFGSWWKWLTYERFTLWASVLLIPLVVKLIPVETLFFARPRFRFLFSSCLILALLAMATCSAFLGTEPSRRTFLPSPNAVNINRLVEFLNGPEVAQSYRYITLGFGEAQFQKLSALSNAQGIDGTYYTARMLPILRESGIATLDSSRYFDPQLTTLNTVLQNAATYNLKWVLVNEIDYYAILGQNGFTLKWSAEILFDSRLNGVTIWEKADVPPIDAEIKSETGLSSYMWGTAPLGLVALLIIAIIARGSQTRRMSASPEPNPHGG